MRVWVYAICKDEKPIVGYFLRHYSTFAEKIIIYDGGSIDGTRQEIADCPKAELRDWIGSTGIVDHEFLDFAHEQWKEARGRAEWVAWLDLDEFLYHPNITEVLQRYLEEGVEVPQVRGFTMVSDQFPTTKGQIYDEVKTGFYDDCWSKNAIFRAGIHWNVGRHSINKEVFNPRSSKEVEIKMLHYRCLGLDYLKNRHQRNWDRVPQHCRERNYGTNCAPGYQGHHGVDWFAERLNEPRVNVI